MKCESHYPILGNWEKIEDEPRYATYQCPKCKQTETIGRHRGIIGGQKVHAIWETDSGETVKTNRKGAIINSGQYDNDSRGWKRAGKKIGRYDSHNKKLRENYR